MSRLAFPQVGQRDTEEVVEAVDAGVVAVIVSAFTVKSQVPFSWDQDKAVNPVGGWFDYLLNFFSIFACHQG